MWLFCWDKRWPFLFSGESPWLAEQSRKPLVRTPVRGQSEPESKRAKPSSSSCRAPCPDGSNETMEGLMLVLSPTSSATPTASLEEIPSPGIFFRQRNHGWHKASIDRGCRHSQSKRRFSRSLRSRLRLPAGSAGADRYGDSRPFQTEPSVTQIIGPDYLNSPADKCLQSRSNDGSHKQPLLSERAYNLRIYERAVTGNSGA